MLGRADVIVAGGAESLSDIPILHSRRMSTLLVEASKARSLGQRLGVLSRIRLKDLVPVTPAIAEPSTGESMGQSAEKMAQENGIRREDQDRVALLSHQRAAAATADGRLTAEIAPWFGGRGMDDVLTGDNGVRADTSLEALAKLKPVFDRRYGSVTAGNASPLTDGGAAVVLMADEKARALGYRPLATIRSYAVAAVDPGWQLLMGPAVAVPRALERAGLAWGDIGLVEIRGLAAGAVERAGVGSKAWRTASGSPARWARSTGTSPTCSAGRSPSGTPSAPPAHGSSPHWPTRCTAATCSSG
jgi:acetyl-CoA acyltransferase